MIIRRLIKFLETQNPDLELICTDNIRILSYKILFCALSPTFEQLLLQKEFKADKDVLCVSIPAHSVHVANVLDNIENLVDTEDIYEELLNDEKGLDELKEVETTKRH